MSDPIEQIRQREQAATPGPWGWRGHISGSVALITLHSGGRTVLDTQRADPCIVTTGGPGVWDTELVLTWEACGTCRKAFADRDLDERIKCEKPENTPTIWVQSERGGAVPLNQYAKAEVAQWSKEIYRDDVKDTTHPDAEFIAQSREDVPVLLDAVDRIRKLHHEETITALRAVAERVAFFHKQWGGRTPKAAGRELDGRTWDEYPTTAVRA